MANMIITNDNLVVIFNVHIFGQFHRSQLGLLSSSYHKNYFHKFKVPRGGGVTDCTETLL